MLLWATVYCSLNINIRFFPIISWLLKSKYWLDVLFEILDFIVCIRTTNYLCIPPCMERSESCVQNCQWQKIYLLCYGFGILLPLEDVIQNFVQEMSKWATICKTKELQYIIRTWCQIIIHRYMQTRIINKRIEGYKRRCPYTNKLFWAEAYHTWMDWNRVCGVPFVSQQSMKRQIQYRRLPHEWSPGKG